MVLNKKAAENEIRFVIGLIIGVGILILFVKCFVSILNIEDESVKSFQRFGSKIEALKGGSESVVESSLLHIKEGQMILFFDKETNVAIYVMGNKLKADFDKGPFRIYDALHSYDYFKNNGKEWFIIDKPKECGNESCAVLCNKLSVSRQSSYYFTKYGGGSEGIADPANEERVDHVVCTEKKAVTTFKNINHFYRKPVDICLSLVSGADESYLIKALKYSNSVDGMCGHPHDGNYYSAFYYGFFLHSSYFDVTDDMKGGKAQDAKFKDSNQFKVFVSEAKQNSGQNVVWQDFQWITKDTYIYMQPFDDGVVFCYQSPCLTADEEYYLRWKNDLVKPCLESSEKCGPLKARFDSLLSSQYQTINLKTEIINEKKVLRVTINDKAADGTVYPEKTFYFDFDAKLRVRTKNTGKESPELTELIFSRKGPDDAHPMIAPFVALNSAGTYTLNVLGESNSYQNNAYPDAKLDNIFSYKPENEQTELIFEVYEMI